MPRHRSHPDVAAPTGRPAHRPLPGRLAPVVGLLLVLGASVEAAPIDLTGGPGLFGDRETVARERAIATITDQTSDGLIALGGDYVRGLTTPLPDPVAVDFLLARAAHTGDAKLKDHALGAVAAWSALLRNDYFKWGFPDSTTPGLPAGRSFKTVEFESTFLRLVTRAWQASGKEIFRQAAVATGDDLVKWALPAGSPGVAHGWTSNDPDTLFGAATPFDRFELAASLTQAALVFDRADWRERVAPLETAAVDLAVPAGSPVADRVRARRLEVLRLETPGFAPPAGKLTDWRPAPHAWPADAGAAADTLEAAWSGLAFARYAARAHDDSARAEAERLLAPLGLADAPETRRMELFAARAAAALALEFMARPGVMAYVVGSPALPATQELVVAAAKSSRPGRLVALHAPDEEGLLYPPSGDGTPIVYVCSGELCAPPTPDAAEVSGLVNTFALPGADDAGLPPEN